MSSAAIRSMICSLSCVGSSIAGSSHARRCTVGPAARGSCKETGESRSRARSNKEGPNGAAPSARLLNDLEDQGTTTSTGGRTPIFSPERAARQGDRRLLTEQLRQVFQLKGAEGIALLDAWLKWAWRCRLPAFVKLARSIRDHRAGIDAALSHGLSNARVESVNTKLRLLTRIAFGFRSPEALVALAMLDLGGMCPPLPGRAIT